MSAQAPDVAAGFRRLMARFATGVCVVTAHDGGVDGGLTVNALLSVSLRPPSLLVSLMRDVDTLPLIERSRAFAVSFLAHDQRALSERFAATVPSAEKFRGVAIHRGASGAARLEGALGSLDCRLVSTTPAYDHVLVLGEVVGLATGREAAPLVFYRSGYAEEDGEGRLRLPPPPP